MDEDKYDGLEKLEPCEQDAFCLTPEFKAIEAEVDKRIVEQIGEGGYIGYCHGFWRLKKKILKEEYGIDWKSPAELFPFVLFD